MNVKLTKIKKKYPEIKTLQCDGRKIPLKDNTFDIVIADQVVEHLTNPNRFFYESKRILKEDGILCSYYQ